MENLRSMMIAVALSIALLTPDGSSTASQLKSDEEVVLFPTACRLSADNSRWVVPIHAWVFEPECDSLMRKSAISTVATSLDLEDGSAASETFRERISWFLVDNESGKRIDLTLFADARDLGPSRGDGHLFAEVGLAHTEPAPPAAPEWRHFRVNPPDGDQRRFTGQTLLVPNTGLSVISDI